METFFVLFEDHSVTSLTVKEIAKFCKDPKSWFALLRVMAGYADHTIIKIGTFNHKTKSMEYQRAGVFLERPPYEWRMPKETA